MAALAYKKNANTPHAFVQLAHKRASLISQMHAMPRVRNAVRQPVWIELTWITMQLKSASVAIGIIKKRLDRPAMTLSDRQRRKSKAFGPTRISWDSWVKSCTIALLLCWSNHCCLLSSTCWSLRLWSRRSSCDRAATQRVRPQV